MRKRPLNLPPLLAHLCLLPAAACAGPPAGLEIVAKLNEAPGNITVTPTGRVIVSLHQFFSPPFAVAELDASGRLRPFPNAAWHDASADGRAALDSVLGVQCDRRGVVWMLDNGLRSKRVPKLVGWDTKKDALHRVIYLPSPITRPDSFVNDLAVDAERDAIYIADPAGPQSALIVVDASTGDARRVLEGHPSMTPDPAVEVRVGGKALMLTGADGVARKASVGVDPIALDAKDEWLYFGPLSGTILYRVPAAALRDASLPVAALAQRVERYADRPVCDGIAIDTAGNVYVSAIQDDAVGVVAPAQDAGGRPGYRELFRDAEVLSWPDAFSGSPDGWMYVVLNQLHHSPPLSGGTNVAKPPFLVARFRPLAPPVAGR